MSVMRAALYLQGSPGDAHYTEQVDAIELVRSRGWDLVTTFSDPRNRNPDVRQRPGIATALRGAVSRSYDVLVISGIDRMFCTLHELVVVLEVLRAHDIAFVSAREPALDTTDSASAHVLHELVQVFATHARVIQRARLSLGIARARRGGVRIGRPPTELPTKRVRALRAAGHSWREIAERVGISHAILHRALREEDELVPKSRRATKPAHDVAAAAP
jgi:DNA invertase Pin-like site-specific DNA recombinase